MGRVRKEEDLLMILGEWVHYLVDHLPILKSLRFTDAPSAVAVRTFSWHHSSRSTASQNGSNWRSLETLMLRYCAYRNWRCMKRPLTMKIVMLFVKGSEWGAATSKQCSNSNRWLLISPRLTKAISAPDVFLKQGLLGCAFFLKEAQHTSATLRRFGYWLHPSAED